MYITCLGIRGPRSLVRACIFLVVVFIVYLLLTSPPSLLKYESPDLAVDISAKRDLLAHMAPYKSLAKNVTFNCALMSTQILPITAVRNVEFYFFGKPIMQVLKEVCEDRNWKWKLLLNSTSTARLERLIHADALSIIYGTSKALEHSFIRRMTTSQRALVATVSKAFLITGPKNKQLMAYRQFVSSHGCSLDDLKLIPKSFLLGEEKDCMDFFILISKRARNTWIIKPYGGYGGQNIEIFNTVSPLIKKYGKCDRHHQYLAQEYLPNLLLLNGRKFDVRAYILIARTNPYFLFYHPGYLRVAINKFSTGAGKEAHLTNTHVQSHVAGFTMSDHFWSFAALQQYISNTSMGNDDFVQAKLEPIIKQTGLFILQAGTYTSIINSLLFKFLLGLHTFERLPGTYLMLGLDFMITVDYHVWFIEANNYPLWPSNVVNLDKDTHTMAVSSFATTWTILLCDLLFYRTTCLIW